ncbi:Sec-23 interacting protein P125 [Nesidiocoris tenuis]|uniref:Sec-23 interacting protein P125 n=1 Tax=Nesidiocoris tenuis TaxID=355587 RepID=A0ABN7BCG0_9HEMI|nr:Sec-23 interacting protein P125 [Nesidiocoris tenuis]
MTIQLKPRIVKRGLEDFEISEGEPTHIDHLLLVVHGIGKVCDLRFRSLVEVVEDFRSVSLQLVQSHFRRATELGQVGRVEVLPVEWHQALHTEAIDKRLDDITLPSIPKAREFTNNTILDVLFYSSPMFSEKIVQAVGFEVNRTYSLFMKRNPGFTGGVSLGGHSLGSLILFDILTHQKEIKSPPGLQQQSSIEENEEIAELGSIKSKRLLTRRMSYLSIGTQGAGQPLINYPQLEFNPKAFFAFGSPIGMFVTVRGIENLGEDFRFPTCPRFFNIFHPNDPVAYRTEALICNEMAQVPPVLIPHHKGRKRMHLELKDTMANITAALKQKLVQSVRSTWNSVFQLAMFQRPADSNLQREVDKALVEEVLGAGHEIEPPSPSTSSAPSVADDPQHHVDVQVGSLNGGNRIDYVLQEAPLEHFNQYISAVRSHFVYWESEDTMLMVLKQIYETMDIKPDSQVAQQILPFDINGEDDHYTEYTDSIGAPPTAFVRK